MKIIITTAIALALGQSALACSPAKDLLQVQPGRISAIISDSIVTGTLRELGATDMNSIQWTDKGYKITASNGCSVTARMKMKKSEHPGMCGQTDGVEIVETACEEKRSLSDFLEGA